MKEEAMYVDDDDDKPAIDPRICHVFSYLIENQLTLKEEKGVEIEGLLQVCHRRHRRT